MLLVNYSEWERTTIPCPEVNLSRGRSGETASLIEPFDKVSGDKRVKNWVDQQLHLSLRDATVYEK
jgi:hypothetical protein